MGKLASMLWSAAIGAGLMYFQDPHNGNRRKAMLRDQVYRIRNQGEEALDVAVHDLQNRARGVMAEGMAMFSQEGLPDNILEERIRARMGSLSRHAGAVQVSAQNGTVMLSGDVLAEDVDHLVKGIRKVRGVHGVENNLRTHQEAGNIPQLQGEGWLPGQNGNTWSPAGRLLAGIGAAYLLLYGMFRGGLVGLAAKGGALYLGTRALTNKNLREIAGPSLFGKDPKSEMDADLVRMKSLLETGKTTAQGGKVTHEEVGSTSGKQRAGVPVTGMDSASETDMGLGMGMEGDTGTES